MSVGVTYNTGEDRAVLEQPLKTSPKYNAPPRGFRSNAPTLIDNPRQSRVCATPMRPLGQDLGAAKPRRPKERADRG